MRPQAAVGDLQHHGYRVGGLGHGGENTRLIGADEARTAVDYRLWGEGGGEAETSRINTLSLRGGRQGIMIWPAQTIPIVHVEGERNGIRHAGEFPQYRIGRRTGATTLRSV